MIKKNVILNNASVEGRFANDPYVKKNRPRSILCAPISHKGKLSGIIYLENNLTTNAFTPARLELLRVLSSQAAICIENARLLVHRENAARLQTEMQIAEKIQTSLLPASPGIRGYDICAYMKTADDVGGDYYDVINTADRDWIIIGDVSGHGIPAGLVMMMTQTAIQTVLDKNPDITPSILLSSINGAIAKNIKRLGEYKYITITAFAFHENGSLSFSGLHQDILIYRTKTDTVEVVPTDGAWVGLLEDISHINSDQTLSLDIGDTVLLHTDGITEAWIKGSTKNNRTPEKDMFGLDRLKNCFEKSGTSPLEDIRNGLLMELKNYDCIDDVTLVLFRRVDDTTIRE
jgi:serine phosphatase RsbU (regulator of sigma subunit)